MAIDTIEKDRVVAFSYTVTDETGNIIEQRDAKDPMVYLHGYRHILPALERALAGKAMDDEVNETLPPELAYGHRNENGIQRVPIKHLLTQFKRYRPGMLVRVNTNQGQRDVTIVKVGKFNVDVDINHPYAGKTLTFDIKVETIREPTPDELAHGHAHGLSGHEGH